MIVLEPLCIFFASGVIVFLTLTIDSAIQDWWKWHKIDRIVRRMRDNA